LNPNSDSLARRSDGPGPRLTPPVRGVLADHAAPCALAEELASTNSERAVIAVLAPVCADKFRALPGAAARTATLVADKGDSYKMREAFPEAMITLPDKSTAACADLILAPPKTADLKP
jgi:hypothetical protein